MFEILYRITDTNDELTEWIEDTSDMYGDILGFFAINVNGYHYGHYHNYPLQPGECDWERITEWFLILISVYQELTRSNYVAVNVVDSYCAWLEFRKSKDIVTINVIYAEKKCEPDTSLRLTPFDDFEYGNWYIQLVKDGKTTSELVDRRNESVKLSRFRSELLRKASQYLEELHDIDPRLLGKHYIAKLEALLPCL